VYTVDEKEKKCGKDPEQEAAEGGFHEYSRP